MSLPNTFSNQTIQIEEHGGVDVMQWKILPLCAPNAGEVQIQHHAIGLNFIDVYHRNGLYPLPLPAALGMEGAGIVLAVGEGVHHLHVGDRVAYASQPPGSYCNVRTMPAQNVCVLPDAISFETAAGMMLKGLTVQYLLRKTLPQGGLQAGDHILFHAGAGGVGLIACQWARALGLQLIATASNEERCQLALDNGAAHAINYKSQDIAKEVRAITGGRGVKVVYDSVGKDTWEASLDSLAPFGLMVSYGNASGAVPPVALSQLAVKGSLYLTRPTLFTHLSSRVQTQAMVDELFSMVETGKVRIRVEHKYTLQDVSKAHGDLEARKITGSAIFIP
jgi:NADPH:quinone reductase